MSDQQSSYRQIVKATSIFGGVQVFQVIIQIIKSKFIAVLLGPAGMGIAGLLNNTTSLIGVLTSFGLGTSAIKNVAEANATNDIKRISTIIIILRRLVWITGLLGTVVVISLSSWLSLLTFGNHNYTYAFIWISITLLFTQLSSGQMVVLQGMRKLKYLANANLTGSLFGLIISVPIYYTWGIDGIVPTIIISSFISMLRSWYFAKKIKIEKVYITFSQTKKGGKEMIRMGFFISLQGLFVLVSAYIVQIFISRYGGVDEVGLYNAGFSLVNTYVGMIFSAMATDFYPRLSAVSLDNKKMAELVNQNVEIALLIVSPIIILFIVFIRLILPLLYSTKFLAIEGMVIGAIFAIFFKAIGASLGTCFIAKGDTKYFIWNESIAVVYMLILNVLGYYYMGLMGIGLAFFLSYFIYLIQVSITSNKRYNIKLEIAVYKILVTQMLLSGISIILVVSLNNYYRYIIGGFLIIISFWYSFNGLENRLELIKNIKNKFGK